VTDTADVARSFIVHGGLTIFQRQGLWPAFSDLVARAARTRGFGDWWGHILVAEGRCDAMVEGQVALHDVAALKPIIEEAGGVFTTRNDAPLKTGFQEATLSSNRNLAGELRGILGF
jgi:histidinol-phosphatase